MHPSAECTCSAKSSQHLGLAPVWKAQHQVHNRLQRRRPIGLGSLLCRGCCVVGSALLRDAPCCQDELLHTLWRQLLAMLSAWARIQHSYAAVSGCTLSCKPRRFLVVCNIKDASALDTPSDKSDVACLSAITMSSSAGPHKSQVSLLHHWPASLGEKAYPRGQDTPAALVMLSFMIEPPASMTLC